MSKRNRRAEAIKKSRQKKIILFVSVFTLIATVFTVSFIIDSYKQNKDRVFTDTHQTVTLRSDGTFTAKLVHETKDGTYTEKAEGDNKVVSFVYSSTTVSANIEGDILTLPEEWGDIHGHGTKLIITK